MKTKAEQIEELKATAVKLQQQIAELEKPKQWEPRGDYRIKILKEDTPTLLTQKAAEKAGAAMRTHNRLLAYVDEFGGDWEADWADEIQVKYSVFYAYIGKLWKRDFSHTLRTESTVYMSRDCSEGLVAKLNSGEVTL